MNSRKLEFNFYSSVQEAFIHKDDVAAMDFEDCVQLLEGSIRCLDYKEQGRLFNFCSYKKSGYQTPTWCGDETRPQQELIRRCKSNVVKIYCLLLDVDGSKDMLTAMTEWHAFEYVLYTTFNHHTAKYGYKDKFRMVIPLEVPLTRDEFDDRHDAMCTKFGVDGASFTISQAFYFPSYCTENANEQVFYWHRSEVRFDALSIPAITTTRSTNSALSTISSPGVPISNIHAAALLHSLSHCCSGLHYSDVLSLATLMKSQGLQYCDFLGVVQSIAAADSTLRTDEVDLAKLWGKGYSLMTIYKSNALLKRLNCTRMPWLV